MRKVLGTAGLACVALGALASVSSSAPTPPAARSIRDIVLRADAADARLNELLQRAKYDPRLEAIFTYETYGAEELNDSNNRLVWIDKDKGDKNEKHVSLLDLVFNDDLPPDIREAAERAVMSDKAKNLDPQLAMQGRRKKDYARTKQSERVLKYLTSGSPGDSKDILTRTFANNILNSWWQGIPDNDIKAYDPRNKSSWQKAKDAWTKYLSK
jgi:hypothetical protein